MIEVKKKGTTAIGGRIALYLPLSEASSKIITH